MEAPALPSAHRLRTTALVNLAAVLERCDEQACVLHCERSICTADQAGRPSEGCPLVRSSPPQRCFHIRAPLPAPQMLPAAYRWVGAAWSATPTQLGYITLAR